MISALQGEVIHKGVDQLVVMVGGIGLSVFCTRSVCDSAKIGEVIYLHTHLVVREDSLTLFGFESADMRDFYQMLLGVNGVGPRIALAIVSTLNLDTIRKAVVNEQSDVFARVTGVGKKTAQKILLHLQDKLPQVSGLEQLSTLSDLDAEVMSALTSLGYSIVESQSALQAIPRDAPRDLESRIRIALQYFTR
jgi:Holliday junction DNA helicase RuvA